MATEPNSVAGHGGENAQANQVLEFWFETSHGTSPAVLGRRLWFQSDPVKQRALDDEIIRRFGPMLASAEQGALLHWVDQGILPALALIIVLDQFSRHVHRKGTPDRVSAATDMGKYLKKTRVAWLCRFHIRAHVLISEQNSSKSQITNK
jgi:uncharacterized protein (DUF924 family)